MNFEQAATLAAQKSEDFSNLVNSEDGQKIKSMMEGKEEALKKAFLGGDMSDLKNTFDQLMQTEEGARIIGQIQGMMGK